MRSAAVVPASATSAILPPTAGAAADPAPGPGPGPSRPRRGRRDAPRSLWSIVDADGSTTRSLPEDDPDVQSILAVVARWTAEIDSRRWTGIEAGLDREWTHYSAAFGESLGDAYRARIREYYLRNRIDTEPQLPGWFRSTLTDDRATAVVSISSRTTLVAAASQFLESSGLRLGTGFVEPRRITLSRSDGRWLLTSVERRPAQRIDRTAS